MVLDYFPGEGRLLIFKAG